MKFKYLIVSAFLVSLASCTNDAQNEILETDTNFLKKKTKSNWNEADFYQVRFLQIGNLKPKTANIPFQLSEGLLIEEITKSTYDNESLEKNRLYLKDTLALIKKEKQITIGKTILKDSNYKNGSFEFYNYLGFFPVMNQYLIKGDYLDSLDYKMIDKNSGEIKQSFINYPIISKFGDFTAISKTNENEKLTYFEIFKFEKGFYKSLIKVNFTNWRIVNFEEFAFWGKDGSLYLKIDKMNDESEKFESFIKITLN